MNYKVLSIKWRPKSFNDLIGQDHVKRTLVNAVKYGRIAQAYLFTGPRGVGKTSTARILAMAMNAEQKPSIDFNPNSNKSLEISESREFDRDALSIIHSEEYDDPSGIKIRSLVSMQLVAPN